MSKSTDRSGIRRAADVVLERFGVAENDRFLVVYNPGFELLATTLGAAAHARTENVCAFVYQPTSRDGEEPPQAVAAAMLEASAIAILSRFSLSHTGARVRASDRGARIASMPEITPEVFARAIPADYAHLERVGRLLADELTAADSCRVTAPGGTEIELSLRGRRGISDDGDLRAPAAFNNLPAGEAFIAPIETQGTGSIVFDGSLASWGLLAEPLTVELEQGRASTIKGGAAAEWLMRTLERGGPHGRTIAELGIGTNPAAMITGSILEDEKVQGTIHIAFGTNTGMGGVNQASVHLDALVRNPSVSLDGRTVIRNGKLLVT